MRNIWFGDNRDIVKWSTLLHVADHYNLKHILQICFLNSQDFPPVIIDGREFQVPGPIIQFFRDVNNAKNICSNVTISIFDEPFNDRAVYLAHAINFISNYNSPKCVFLDPDTGLAPSKANRTHVTNTDVHKIWQSEYMNIGDMLVIYQHQTNRNGKAWIEEKQLQMATAIEVDVSKIKIAKGSKIAHDVVFLYTIKA